MFLDTSDMSAEFEGKINTFSYINRKEAEQVKNIIDNFYSFLPIRNIAVK